MKSHTNVSMLKKKCLNLLDQGMFTIIVNDKKYFCSILGINSSEVIRELREKNPKLDQYKYEFDEPADEFQLICDYFNFKKVHITTKNMNSLRIIAENLKINAVLADINDFINSYEEIVQKTDPIEEIFHLLYHIKEISIEAVRNTIINSIWVQSEENIKELASFILQVVRSSFLIQSYLADLIISLDENSEQNDHLKILKPFIINHLLSTFFTNQFYCCFIFKFIKKGVVSLSNVIDTIFKYDPVICSQNGNKVNQSQIIRFDVNHHRNVCIWFFPELISIASQNYQFDLFQLIDTKTKNALLSYWPDKIENYKKIRDSCEPDNDILISIVNDDVDTLQSIISKTNINLNSYKIPFNLFEIFIDSSMNNLLNYSAEYGSIKCFKYLLLNHAKINDLTLGYAIYGGNTEIIRIVDQKNSNNWPKSQQNQQQLNRKYFSFDPNNLFYPINITIMMHQYDLFDWIFDQKIEPKMLTNQFLFDLANVCVISGNIHSFIRCVDKGLSFTNNNNKQKFIDFLKTSSEFGYYQLTEFILSLFNSGKLFSEISESSIIFGNISIFKLFVELNNFQFDYDRLLSVSLIKNFNDISYYIIENLYQPKSKEFTLGIIQYSIGQSTSDIFNLIDRKFNLEELMKKFNITLYDFINLLNIACYNKKFEISCKLTDLVLKNFQYVDFTTPFIEACVSGCEQIFQYFIDKKVLINFSEILNYHQSILQSNWKIAIKLLDVVDIELKDSLSKLFFLESSKNNHKEAFKILLPYNLDNKCALFVAITYNDLDSINFILQHKSKPSFVNHISHTGTALSYAVQLNCIDIIKRLLLVPGIDPSLSSVLLNTPLIISIKNLNIEAMDLLLNFYGDDIQSQLNQLIISLNELQHQYIKENSNLLEQYEEKLIIIINRLIQINKNISINDFDFLNAAVEKNSIKFVQNLLKIDNINVNRTSTNFGDTPLMVAIKNKNTQIARLLIDFPTTNINLLNYNNQSSLLLAVLNEMDDIVSAIINHPKFDPDDSVLNFSFLVSSDNQTILNYLYSHQNLDVNHLVDHSIIYYQNLNISLMETTLTYAVKQNQINKFNLIITHPKFDPVKSHIKDALFTAIFTSHVEMIEKLIKFVNDVNIKSSTGLHLFEALIANKRYNLVFDVIKNPSFVIDDHPLMFHFTNILISKDDYQIEILNMLIDYDNKHNHCIDLNQRLNDGKTFYTSIDLSNENISLIVQFLLNHNADPNQPDKFGIYPLQYAIESKCFPYVKTLIDSQKVDYSIKLNYSTLFRTELKNESYLHLAARCSDKKILKIFLDKNLIDIDITDDLGETPYMKAIKTNHKHNAHMIEKKLNPSNENNDSNSDDDNDEGNEELTRETFMKIAVDIQNLLKQLEILTESYEDENMTIRQIENFDIISQRKSLIKSIQNLFNKLNIFETPFADNDGDDDNNNIFIDDLLDLTDIETYYIDQSISDELFADDSGNKFLDEIQKLFNEIKIIDKDISSGEILDFDQKLILFSYINARVSIINQFWSAFMMKKNFN